MLSERKGFVIAVFFVSVLFAAITPGIIRAGTKDTGGLSEDYKIAVFDHHRESHIADLLSEKGYRVVRLTADDLAAGGLENNGFDCFIMAESPYYPSEGMESFYDFIRGGGDWVSLGGAAFSRPLTKQDGEWADSDDVHVEFYEAFEDYEVYDLDRISRVTAWENQAFFSGDMELARSSPGRSAVAVASPNESAFIPLLHARDRYGRHRGWAGSLLINCGGRFPGSQWALFGLEERSFYEEDSFIELLCRILDSFPSGELLETYEGDYLASAKDTDNSITTEEHQRVVVNEAGTGFEYEDGSPFFMVGANICGCAGFRHWAGPCDPELLEATFKRMSRAGINALRVRHGGIAHLPHRAEMFKEFANRYGVYLLLELGPRPRSGTTREDIVEKVSQAAGIWKGETMLLGYDLDNEPYPWEMSGLEIGDGVRIADKYPMRQGEYELWVDPGYFSLFQNLDGQMPPPDDEEIKKHYTNINRTIETWLDIAISAIREIDRDTPITVGYNHTAIAYPANERLDFVNNHIYPNNWANNTDDSLTDYNTVKVGLTTMDRLHSMWPEKPISVGEFGFSSGLEINDGTLLDVDTSAVMEFIYYLYALEKGYSGIMKWMVDDWPTASLVRDWDTHKRQGKFGLFYYDGTMEGGPKPVAHSLSFLRDYLDSRDEHNGTLEITELKGAELGLKYVYRDNRALFIGASEYEAGELSFQTLNKKPANMMLTWSEEEIHLMASNDASVRIRPAQFLEEGLKADEVRTRGLHGDLNVDGDWLEIKALEGEVVTVHRQAD